MSSSRPLPLSSLILGVILPGLVIVTLLTGAGWWISSERALVELGGSKARSLVKQIEAQMNLRILTAEHIGDSLATLWGRGVLEPGARPGTTAAMVAELIGEKVRVSAAVLIDSQGNGMILEQHPTGWLIRTVRREGTTTFAREFRLGDDETLIGPKTEQTWLDTDFRARPWSKAALERGGPVWIEPYFFGNTQQDLPEIGITYALPVRAENGEMIGIVGVDFELDDLSELSWEMQPSPNSILTIMDRDGRVLVLPRLPDGATQKDRARLYLNEVGPDLLPEVAALRVALPADQGKESQTTLDLPDGKAYGLLLDLDLPQGLGWSLAAVVPQADFLSAPRRMVTYTLGMTVLFTLLMGFLLSRVFLLIYRPLLALADVSNQLGHADRPPFPESRVQEVVRLSEALQAAEETMAEKELLLLRLTQAKRMESIGRLAGGVAHDFNNMLQVILGNAAIALSDLPADSEARSSVDEILEAGRRSANLTRQLLVFARKQTITPEVVNLNETVGIMLNMLGRLIGESIELRWSPGESVGSIEIDPSQLDQILVNLCINARDAIRGIGKVSIETHNVVLDGSQVGVQMACEPGNYVQLLVSDTGVGMDTETMSHIFEPFFTTKGVGEGTGLGLATVFGIVSQNRGLINVYSEPGYGTTFQIYLPRIAGTPDLPKETSRPVATGIETLLLVEDESQILELCQSFLTGRGYTVLAAATPQAALEIAAQYAGPIQLLVTDVIMPGLNGKELRDRLRISRPGLKCLFMSGYTAEVIAFQGVLQGEASFLQKPFAIQSLSERIRQVLENPAGD